MLLYHGSSVPGLTVLRPFLSNHGKPWVYLTHSRVLATLYAHNPLTRPNGFFTYWWGRDSMLYYDEYFDNQMEEIYSGKRGYVYECTGDYPQMEKMPWVYLAGEEVSAAHCTGIADIYEQLLRYEQEGLLTVRRWKEASSEQRKIWENVVRRSLAGTDPTTAAGKEYFDYVMKHFGDLRSDSVNGG